MGTILIIMDLNLIFIMMNGVKEIIMITTETSIIMTADYRGCSHYGEGNYQRNRRFRYKKSYCKGRTYDKKVYVTKGDRGLENVGGALEKQS